MTITRFGLNASAGSSCATIRRLRAQVTRPLRAPERTSVQTGTADRTELPVALAPLFSEAEKQPSGVRGRGSDASTSGHVALDAVLPNWYISQVMNPRTARAGSATREQPVLDDGAPIFSQVAERLAEEIAVGALAEGEQVPSTNELAAYYRINPATAAKGINVLTDDGSGGEAAGHRHVRVRRRPRTSARRPPQAFRRTLCRPDGRRGQPARDRGRRVGGDGPESEPCTGRYEGMTPTISTTGLTRRYRGQLALDEVTLDFEGPSITGLLGRNGAGKSTLMRIIAAQEFASAGTVQVFGASPVENDAVLRRMVLVREDQVFPDIKVRQALRVASWFYPQLGAASWPRLCSADFELPADRAIKKLSRGMRSALGIVVGLAARAEVTLFDEPYAGLDAVARRLFYDRLLADYAEHPRTVVLSTHLIDEVADLLERVVIIDHGRVVLDADADDVRGSATTVSGQAAAVEEFVVGRRTWDRRRVASRESVVVGRRARR